MMGDKERAVVIGQDRNESSRTDDDPTIANCPLCVFEGDSQAVYRHLQTSHRKSELSRTLLDKTRKTQQADAN